ncbi:MAG TPA: hypothetical protein VIP56_13290, partial [Nitrososphaeraceae archaeon]
LYQKTMSVNSGKFFQYSYIVSSPFSPVRFLLFYNLLTNVIYLHATMWTGYHAGGPLRPRLGPSVSNMPYKQIKFFIHD